MHVSLTPVISLLLSECEVSSEQYSTLIVTGKAIINCKRRKFSGTTYSLAFCTNFICQLQKSVYYPYILVILDEFAKLSSAKLIS